MMNVERGRIAQVSDELLKIGNVTEVYSVAGDYDLIAIVRVKEADELANIVTHQFSAVPGISKTKTQIAFACFSNYDLEHMFEIGATP